MAVRTPANDARQVLLAHQLRQLFSSGSATLFAALLLAAYLMPFLYMAVTSLKDRDQIASPDAPLWPARPRTYAYQGKDYPVYRVPTEDGVKEWALVKKGREESSFVDPANPEAGLQLWVGKWRTLEAAWELSPAWENYAEVTEALDFLRLFRNTFLIAIIGVFGTLLASIPVAYGFARYEFPGKPLLFLLLIGTIILPSQVTLVPTYAFFSKIGWTGTWLPLTVPHFFGNAYNVFLLRQFFMSIPREMDEAAQIDGASPLRTLISIILPQSVPAIITVALFHFFFAWNDFLGPMIYLSSRPELQPLSVGIQVFNAVYSQRPELVQSTAMLGLSLPIVIFFFAQRFLMKGVVIASLEK